MGTDEALKLKKQIQEIARQETERLIGSCVKSKQMTVSTEYSPSTGKVGVKEAFGDEIFLPVLSTLSVHELTVGTAVWVLLPCGSLSNAFVFSTGSGDIGNFVSYESQSPTATEQADARANIDAQQTLSETNPLSIEGGGTAGTTAEEARANLDAEQTLSATHRVPVAFGGTDASTDSGARTNLKINLQTYTNASQIGITLSTSTTLEQIVSAMPNGSMLVIVPSGLATTNISPSGARYGMLVVIREASTRSTATWYEVTSSAQWTNGVYTTDDGSTWTAYGWRRMTTNVLSGIVTITVPSGSANASQTVTFSQSFSTTPIVIPVLNTSFPGGKSCSLDGSVAPSTTGFKVDAGLYTNATSDTNISVRWTAMEVI